MKLQEEIRDTSAMGGRRQRKSYVLGLLRLRTVAGPSFPTLPNLAPECNGAPRFPRWRQDRSYVHWPWPWSLRVLGVLAWQPAFPSEAFLRTTALPACCVAALQPKLSVLPLTSLTSRASFPIDPPSPDSGPGRGRKVRGAGADLSHLRRVSLAKTRPA